jgi:hypothetical protein
VSGARPRSANDRHECFRTRLFRKGLRRALARAFVVCLALSAAGVVLAAVRQVTRSGVPGALSGPCGRYLVAVELQQIVGGGD